ncbi:hypothetical protein PTTG_04540 [Puccinia triticina 1-1 BBBD Race 1]|uniref:Uncharacterized protein n=1 Tax=Puccinia triticina (isolate 1-1 / race 1 (BBBD)) TaxID=630390 RepID=A0A0C4EUQ9_PUCT1|nr:hypothetical protein PTTG_04540 [Puccinia triticina 1-1 BBBD Race 1]
MDNGDRLIETDDYTYDGRKYFCKCCHRARGAISWGGHIRRPAHRRNFDLRKAERATAQERLRRAARARVPAPPAESTTVHRIPQTDATETRAQGPLYEDDHEDYRLWDDIQATSNRRRTQLLDDVEWRDSLTESEDEESPDGDPLETTNQPEVELTPVMRFCRAAGITPAPEEVIRLFQALSDEEKQLALFTTMYSVLTKLNTMVANPMPPPGVNLQAALPNIPITRADQIRAFIYPDETKTYALDSQEQSLFQLVMLDQSQLVMTFPSIPQKKIQLQPREVLVSDFPPGFGIGENDALENVHVVVKRQLKRLRDKVRNVLLTGFIATVASEPTLPKIPNIVNLSRLLWAKLNPGPTSLTPAKIDEIFGWQGRIRLVHLRLATLVNYFDTRSGCISPWDQIDSTLQSYRARTPQFTNHWNRLLAAKDAALFETEPLKSDLNKNEILLPTTQAVLGQMALARTK